MIPKRGTVLVTGAGSGIGLACARRLDSQGYRQILVLRPKASRPPGDWSARVEFETCDLARPADIRALGERLKARYGWIDVVFANAAVQPWTLEKTEEGLEVGFATAVLGTYLLAEELKPLLIAATEPLFLVTGSLVHAWGKYVFGDLAHGVDFEPNRFYYANKLCQMQLVTHFATAWRSDGIAVHAIEPGMTKTAFARHFQGFYRFMSTLWRPLMRNPDDVALDVRELIKREDLLTPNGLNWYRRRPKAMSASASDLKAAAELASNLQNLVHRLADA